MNISQYKKSMNEIDVRKFSSEELISENSKKLKRAKIKKITLVNLFIGIVFLNLIWFNILPSQNSRITFTAYGAVDEMQLSNRFVDFNTTISPMNGGINNDKSGYVNSNIYFRCEGEDIEFITYTSSDQIVDQSNWKGATAYYVENMVIPLSEYNSRINEDDFIYGYYVPGEDTANITKVIGSSYSVNYEDQNDKQYGLILAATVDQTGILQINDAIIKIDVHFYDGSVQHKKMLIRSGQDGFSRIQLKIL